ncbi:D-alanyl-D-alanine carboxypeptidase family protein [Limosilactobacillus fastidiosus]|uniref:D-alanyl-D-alanine carboxypeptidase n=1 Tax=Limosilactobacillus fastidiosus TaxID=2759855 RepID=A0A7W3TYU8_9LACO|nr:D-alanyl-D-alanine carboxypeptidase family protein [Limosilactobacillus fastidiosus]MBB1063482.1 D-alanyl-D-alanine carboxypeptidase [Limosilactobacillus fastidiosus]MBB1085826.1 D-alanyl-D-alanine carboxypeptidase [Limosilactobacillus fastidiosus]MCD7084750.1 D-alanyl-D-alanine carboxypeptidase [Limosilactobacillus fastidiosus]MCD7085837.1 D-alanyl-D-alanine carboxypeptidase [Limosilactobacillus fastidiosus]MCD7113914.1 D-alanyl-D-alanine carboxypeptidase [Limosilactobacillus fastidiosus]
MKKVRTFLLTLFIVLCCMVSKVQSVSADQTIDARSAIMIDADTGQIIYQQNSEEKLPIASISKLLAVIVIEDEINHHQLSWNTKVKINKKIADVSNDTNYSAIGLQVGQSYTVQELFNAALIKSADGAALALAVADGSTLQQFNVKMRKKARQIGITDATIVNPVGLKNGDLKGLKQKKISSNAENAMTARDVALMSQYLVNHYPGILKITSQPKARFVIAKGKVKEIENLNKMLPGGKYNVNGVQIDGLKTGTSDAAGACFVSTGIYQGHRLITVVLHANGKNKDARFTQTQRLYQYFIQNAHQQVLTLNKKQSQKRVTNGTKRMLAVSPRSFTVWQMQKTARFTIQPRYDKQLTDHKGRLNAPVKKGERLGNIIVTGSDIRNVNNRPITVPLRSAETINRGNFWQRIWN